MNEELKKQVLDLIYRHMPDLEGNYPKLNKAQEKILAIAEKQYKETGKVRLCFFR